MPTVNRYEYAKEKQPYKSGFSILNINKTSSAKDFANLLPSDIAFKNFIRKALNLSN